jgi:hypothetical protein
MLTAQLPELPSTPQSWGLFGTAIAIIVVVVYALIRGNLVSRKVLEERDKLWEARLAQAIENSQFWKEAAENRQNLITELRPVLDDIVDNHQTLYKLVLGLKELGESRGD